jgi:6-phosphogluconolactonase
LLPITLEISPFLEKQWWKYFWSKNKWFNITEGTNIKDKEGPRTYGSFLRQKFVLSNDLENDKLYSYTYEPNSIKESLKVNGDLIKSGSGEHLTFSKDKQIYVYLLQGQIDFNYFCYSKELKKIN